MSKFKKGDRVVLITATKQHKRWTKGSIVEYSPLSVSTWSVDFGGGFPMWIWEKDLELDNGVNVSLLDSYSLHEVIQHFKYENILDEIGEELCKEYFNTRTF